jgi:hypothetical protein
MRPNTDPAKSARRQHLLKRSVVCAAITFLLIVPLYYHATQKGLFSRLITRSIPKSLTNLEIDGHDWFGLKPEPVVRMRFSATPEDLAKLLEIRKAAILTGDAICSGASGEPWWPAPASLSTMQGYSLKGKNPQFLWIDSTGTNAYYLLFGV